MNGTSHLIGQGEEPMLENTTFGVLSTDDLSVKYIFSMKYRKSYPTFDGFINYLRIRENIEREIAQVQQQLSQQETQGKTLEQQVRDRDQQLKTI